jgi:transketolase
VKKGAYVLSDVDFPNLVLIATGSEVHVALEAKETLEHRGHRVRVVSAPCLEAFARVDRDEQERILGRGARRVSIEAGRTLPWRGLVGSDGITIGVDTFGASAPWQDIASQLGLTGREVAAQILAQL